MSSGRKPSLRIDAAIIGPELGIPVFRRMNPSAVAKSHEPSPRVPTKESGPMIFTGSVGSSQCSDLLATSRKSALSFASSSRVGVAGLPPRAGALPNPRTATSPVRTSVVLPAMVIPRTARSRRSTAPRHDETAR